MKTLETIELDIDDVRAAIGAHLRNKGYDRNSEIEIEFKLEQDLEKKIPYGGFEYKLSDAICKAKKPV